MIEKDEIKLFKTAVCALLISMILMVIGLFSRIYWTQGIWVQTIGEFGIPLSALVMALSLFEW